MTHLLNTFHRGGTVPAQRAVNLLITPWTGAQCCIQLKFNPEIWLEHTFFIKIFSSFILAPDLAVMYCDLEMEQNISCLIGRLCHKHKWINCKILQYMQFSNWISPNKIKLPNLPELFDLQTGSSDEVFSLQNHGKTNVQQL